MRLAIGENSHQVERGALEEIGVRDSEHALLNHHAGANLARRAAAQETHRCGLFGHARNESLGKAMDSTGVLIVRAHQRRASRDTVAVAVVTLETEHRGDLLLVFEGELVGMAAAEEMQRVANPEEKILRLDHLVEFALRDNRSEERRVGKECRSRW